MYFRDYSGGAYELSMSVKEITDVHGLWNEKTVPDVTPRPMSKIMAKPRDGYAVDFFVGDSQL